MSWIRAGWARRRPLLIVEDHLYHINRLLQAVADSDSDLTAELTVVCLDRPGPDTERAVERWLEAHPALRVVALPGRASAAGDGKAAARSRAPAAGGPISRRAASSQDGGEDHLVLLDPAALASAHAFCRTLAGLLRPGGLLVQDVQLDTLSFLPAERWWESIYLAATVRGMFGERPPVCRFFSNKRGYEATFGRDLVEAGFDPRDVMEKDDLGRVVMPVLEAHLDRGFPWLVELKAPTGGGEPERLRAAEAERELVEAELDLVVWRGREGVVELGGRLLAAGRPRLVLRPGSHEADTWCRLVADRVESGSGLAVLEVGGRLAPEAAGRAEVTNLAARHAHLLRGRLADPGALVTAHHAYRLREDLAVGRGELRGVAAA